MCRQRSVTFLLYLGRVEVDINYNFALLIVVSKKVPICENRSTAGSCTSSRCGEQTDVIERSYLESLGN